MSVPPDPKRVGISYVPFLRGEQPAWRKELFYEYCYMRGVRTANLKYVRRADNWPDELFDLEADPGENTNLIGDRAHAGQLNELKGRMDRFFASAGAAPLEKWRSTTSQTILLDAGYYDGWARRQGPRK